MFQQKVKRIWILLSLTMLGACSTPYSNNYPIQPDCTFIKAGKLTGSLADAYINNTTCGLKYKSALEIIYLNQNE